MPENTPEPEQAEVKEFDPITSQEQLDKIIGDRLSRERAKFGDYDELKAKAEKFDQAEEANKTELEKALERAEKAEQAAREAELKELRLQVASDKGLTPAQARWLTGQTKDELAQNAEQLLADFKPETPAGAPKVPMAGREPTVPSKLSEREAVKQLFS